MKKFLLLTILASFGLAAYAQPPNGCTPDENICTPMLNINDPTTALCIVPDGGILPDAVAGTNYEESLFFVGIREAVGGLVTLNSVEVVGVSGVPSGMDYYTYSHNPVDASGPNGVEVFTPIAGGSVGPTGCATLWGPVPSGLGVDTIEITLTVVPDVSGQNVGNQDVTVRVPYSDVVSITEDIVRELNFSVAPNPATYQTAARFNLNYSAQVGLKVIDLQGRTVFQQPQQEMAAGEHRIQLPYEKLSNGLYMVQLQINDRMETLKLVK